MIINKNSWYWNKDKSGNTVNHKGYEYGLINDEKYNRIWLFSKDVNGIIKQLWEHEALIGYAAFIIVEQNRLFAGVYPENSTGCLVVAIDLISEDLLWEKPLKGLGSVGHSRYSNRVQLAFKEDQLIIYGWEAGGKYIEILDPENGKLIENNQLNY